MVKSPCFKSRCGLFLNLKSNNYEVRLHRALENVLSLARRPITLIQHLLFFLVYGERYAFETHVLIL